MERLKFIYESDGFQRNVKLLGIGFYKTSVLSANMFSEMYPAYPAKVRGLEIYEHHLRLPAEKEMRLIYKNRQEINRMLKEAGAHFEVPDVGACWISAEDRNDSVLAIDFATGKRVDVELAWALYIYIC